MIITSLRYIHQVKVLPYNISVISITKVSQKLLYPFINVIYEPFNVYNILDRHTFYMFLLRTFLYVVNCH